MSNIKDRNNKTNLNFMRPTLLETTRDFCQSTTIHGMKFMGNNNLFLIERLMFVIAFAIISTSALYFILNVYDKWLRSPVIIIVNPKATYVYDIPFPALTICNMNQAKISKVEHLRSDSEEKRFLDSLCNREISNSSKSVPKPTGKHKYRENLSINDFLLNISQPCNSLLIHCTYGGFDMDCEGVFKTVITDDGLCCTFNRLHESFMYMNEKANDSSNNKDENGAVPIPWTLEAGYPNNLPRRYYPRKVAGTGLSMGLSVIVDIESDDYYCSSTDGAGIKFALHSPLEAPQIKETGVNIIFGTQSLVKIKPIINLASHLLRDVNVKYRQCLFDDEIKLAEFSVYSKRNCELECEAEIMFSECSCILYHMPKIKPNLRICTTAEEFCTKQIVYEIATHSYNARNCNDICLPSCFDISYVFNVMPIRMQPQNFIVRGQFIAQLNSSYVSKSISRIDFIFDQNAFHGEIKEQFFGITNFLASTGGFLSLFLGSSFISLSEILYYMTLRPICAEIRYYRNIKQVYPNVKYKLRFLNYFKM